MNISQIVLNKALAIQYFKKQVDEVEMLDTATLVIVGLGLASVPFAFIEYALSKAKREASRKPQTP